MIMLFAIAAGLYCVVGLYVLFRFARGEFRDVASIGGDPVMGTGIFVFLLLIWPLFAIMAAVRHFQPEPPPPPPGEATALADRNTLVGQLGHAVTDLGPTGKVEIGGCWIEAQVASGYMAKGTPVRVTHAGPFHVTVESL